MTCARTGAGISIAPSVHAFNTDNEGIKPDGAACSISASRCKAHVVGRAVWTGDFAGTATYALDFTPQPDGSLAYEGVERMAVTVRGCGTGTFDMRISGGVYDPKNYLPDPSVTVQDYDTWTVVPGGGTGSLTGLTGHGTEVVTEFNNGKTRGELTGLVVSC